MKHILNLLCATVLLSVAAGCKSKSGPYAPMPANNVEDREAIVLMDPMVQQSVTSGGVFFKTLDSGRLEVTAKVQSRDSRRIQVQVQCVFKDANGFGVDDETPWQNLILTENAQEQLQFISMNDQAKKATVRVRQAR